jgi:HK97 family phage prohead protease
VEGVKYLPWDKWEGKADTGLQLTAPAEVADLDNRTLRFTISTSSPDRERDIVSVTGWNLANYKNNPVVLWAHDYRQPPIARAVDVQVIGDRLVASAEFVPKALSPFADSIYQLIKAGFLKGTSVGFRPTKWSLNTERGGMDFQEQELLEFSITPVPAHPDALIEARDAGIDVAPLRAWAEETLRIHKDLNAAAVLTATEQPTLLSETPGDGPSPVAEPPALPTPVPETKAGRVLSGRNESALREATAALAAAVDRVNAVLAQVTAGRDEDEDEEKDTDTPALTPEADSAAQPADTDTQPILTLTDAAEAQVEKDMIVFQLVDDPEPRFTVDPTMVREAIARGYGASLASVVEARVSAAISALRGRID